MLRKLTPSTVVASDETTIYLAERMIGDTRVILYAYPQCLVLWVCQQGQVTGDADNYIWELPPRELERITLFQLDRMCHFAE